MKLWVEGFLLLLAVCTEAMVATGHQPMLAMVCGKVTQHLDLDTGEWVSDATGTTDCITDRNEILAYCKKAYPTLTITNILNETTKVHVPSWCAKGSHPPCKGHGHNVVPVRCIEGQYQTKPLTVPDNCIFQHTHDRNRCLSSQYWNKRAEKNCTAKGLTLSKEAPQMLQPCSAPGLWKGVQYLCCHPQNQPRAKPKDICFQPQVVGNCRAAFPRWSYDPKAGKCVLFIYGGCGGNDNNFMTQEECSQACPSAAPAAPKNTFVVDSVCKLPSETGPCRASFRRWYYNKETGNCEGFIYGGCRGNENNFETLEDCEGRCKVSAVVKPTMINLFPGLGPVMPSKLPAYRKMTTTVGTTSTPPTTTAEVYYSDDTNIDTEHDAFVKKFNDLKAEHQAKVTKILAQWDDENVRLKSTDQEEDLDNLEQDLQMTISNLEDEYDEKMNKLNEYHMNRMDQLLADSRAQTFQKFLDELKADHPRLRQILADLENYIEVEKKDKTHVLEHMDMASRDEFMEENVTELRSRLKDIETRVNDTKAMFNDYPDILNRIKDDIDEIIATMPPTPEDNDDDDYITDNILDFLDKTQEVSTTSKPKIDDGGLVQTDDCLLPMYVGPCKGSITRYYYDAMDDQCKTFFFGGCAENGNNFKTMEECQNKCFDREFDNIDVNGVLDSEDIEDDGDDDMYYDDNSIDSTLDENEPDDETEDESQLDPEIDGMFDKDGNPKFDVQLNDPQAIFSNDIKEARIAKGETHWLVWAGVGVGMLAVIAVVLVIATRRHSASQTPSRVVVNADEEGGKELSLEEKQLLQLQQNGYENPTYKFFEKQMS